jgi:hypothetical protein
MIIQAAQCRLPTVSVVAANASVCRLTFSAKSKRAVQQQAKRLNLDH